MTTAMVKRIGLFGGPLLGLLCYYLLPAHYATDPGEWVEFTPAGRATLALMVWMAGWWLTEAVDIEVTALLPIVTFPLLGIAVAGVKPLAGLSDTGIAMLAAMALFVIPVDRAKGTERWTGTRP